MKIERFLLAGCFFLHSFAGMAAPVEANSKIKEVMVYATGAMVNRTVTANLKNGINEVKIPLLTPQLDQQSVQVGVKSSGVTLVSIDYDVEVPNRKQISKEVVTLTKRSALLRDSIDMMIAKSSVLDRERELILKSNNIGGDNGFTAPTLQGIASYVRKDLNDIINQQYDYQKRIQKCQEELTMNEQKMNLFYEKQMAPMSFLSVKLESSHAGNCELDLLYFVENAAWMPFYEARISRNDTKLHLVQKAYVSQATKEKWESVALSLSQNDPGMSNEKPELGKYEIPSGNYVGRNEHRKESGNPFVKVIGVVRDSKGPLKGALITAGEDRKTQSDENGYYELLVPDRSTVKYSFSGYGPATCLVYNCNNVAVKNVNMEVDKSNVVETSASQKYSNYIMQNRVSQVKQGSGALGGSGTMMNIPQMVIRNHVEKTPGLNTIPDDGADHEVMVKDITVDAEYNYYAVPKLSKEVYLVASIPNWKKLDLLDGTVKLFLNNMYMGESFINARQTEDTLNLSIGKDKELAIERKDLRTYSSKNLIRTSDKVEREWMITVKNNKSTSAKITVEDQFPVSTESDIKVVLMDNGGAEVDEVEGRLTWKLQLKPGEKKELKFSYSVKSKNRNITVD